MLDFSGRDSQAREVMAHFAERHGDLLLIRLSKGSAAVETVEQAVKLAEFFWWMLDQSEADRESGSLLDENTPFWVERLMTIISGYLTVQGFEKEWEIVSDRA
ncbi:hypothetical protein HCH_03029 [Hahella chejuensis KCTC 2396]|uniref:Uncharacterized protein n=1 Tax=Hahella chejuensis (strain KCTC 2396) TaxID=349521 RepID=Q2SHS9_HAHCH|nr:hypothetical protein [Hahella chejuensis]ABC29795.1 hypothetical protein HCH_03029 [Hahella chejuensis KCTC 2396]